jgi:predicted nucleic acid-binding protein
MKIVFDAGVLITFSETCFLDVFGLLKKDLGEFIITKSVKYESIDRAKNINRFKLSSIRIDSQLDSKIFILYPSNKELNDITYKIMDIVNNMFYIKGNPLKIIHLGESESLALLSITNANYFAVDERTTRMLIEQPYGLMEIFKRKYRIKNIKFDEHKYLEFKQIIGNVKAIRSVDLFVYAQKNKLLNKRFDNKENLKAAMYALKFKGCSVSFEEIEEYVREL